MVEERYSEIAQKCYDLWKRKNAAYGNNMSKNFKKYGPVVYALRLSDKLGRLKTMAENPKINAGDESVLDTVVDSICYSIMCAGDIAADMLNNMSNVANLALTEAVFKDFVEHPEIVTHNNLLSEAGRGSEDVYEHMQQILDVAYESNNMGSGCIMLASAMIQHYYTLTEVDQAVREGV